ncbi:MAG: hypothetical protein ACI9MR_004503 [Myxococcota bacterium]|jgi:hypothetical protein
MGAPAGQPELLKDAAPDRRASAVAWRALTSPGALASVLAIIGVFVALTLLTPVRATSRELHESLPYALAELIGQLGLADPLTAWPLLLLGLLGALICVGILVRGSLSASDSEALTDGPWVETDAVALDVGPEEARQRLTKPFGVKKVAWRHEPNGVITTRHGAWNEGFGVFVLGALGLVAAAVVGRATALDGQLTLTAGDPGTSSIVMKARSGDMWVDRVLPVRLACDAAQPLDSLRRHRCTLTTADGAQDIVLQPGVTTSVGPLNLRPLRSRPLATGRSEPIDTLITTAPGEKPKRLAMPQGQTFSLEDTKQQLTALAGPDGPMLVVTNPGASDVPGTLLLPSSAGRAEALASGLAFEAVAKQRLTIEVQTEPQRYLRYAALFLILLGLVLMTLRPAVAIRIAPSIAADRTMGSQVQMTSMNRRGLVARLRAALEQAS